MTYALSGWRAYSHVVRVSAASRNATPVCSHCYVRPRDIGRDYSTCKSSVQRLAKPAYSCTSELHERRLVANNGVLLTNCSLACRRSHIGLGTGFPGLVTCINARPTRDTHEFSLRRLGDRHVPVRLDHGFYQSQELAISGHARAQASSFESLDQGTDRLITTISMCLQWPIALHSLRCSEARFRLSVTDTTCNRTSTTGVCMPTPPRCYRQPIAEPATESPSASTASWAL